MSTEAKLGLSLDDLIKTSKKEKLAARKPANGKAAQVKARSQALRAEKVGKARGMEVDSAGGGSVGKKKKIIIKPSTKAIRPIKASGGRPRPTQQPKGGRGAVGVPKGAKGKQPGGGSQPPTGLIVQVRVDPQPQQRSPAPVGRGRGGGGRGGRGGRAPALVQPIPGRRAPAPASKPNGAGGGRPGSGGRGGRGIIKPVPRAPGTFGSKAANAAAMAAAARLGSAGKKGKGRNRK